MQGDLFSTGALPFSNGPDFPLQREQLLAWQQRLHDYQAPLFRRETTQAAQGNLFGTSPDDAAASIDPLSLTPVAMSFWRWPAPSHRGPAIYLVMDRPAQLEQPLLLYVGETLAAERRWRGDHDCKAYLAAYGESLQRCELGAQLSIRFSCDVPRATRARRSLEQQLIQRWWPPFNKEPRQRWATPFTAEL